MSVINKEELDIDAVIKKWAETPRAVVPTNPTLTYPDGSIVPLEQRFVASVVIFEGKSYVGARHGHCLWQAIIANGNARVSFGEIDEGFMLGDGTFVDRITGAKLAMVTGQLRNGKLGSPPRLYSEDLW